MLNEQVIDKALERFYNRFGKYNTKVLKELGKVIKRFSNIETNETEIIAQEIQNQFVVDELLSELDKLYNKTIKDIDTFYDIVAISNLDNSKIYYDYRNEEFIPYKDDMNLQQQVRNVKKEISSIIKDLPKSKNIGFVFEDENKNIVYKGLRDTYNSLIDKAIENVSLGKQDYQSAMRSTIRQLANSGVRIHEDKLGYKNGYNMRIDSAIRQQVMNGLRQVNAITQNKIAEELKTDGVEVSLKWICALDHLPYQGRRFTNEKFEEIQSSLDRPIEYGYNCGHSVFPIILGVNEPNYTKEDIKEAREETLRKINYKGKKYNAYEATQVQRKIETAIRQQKDRQIMARASGNKEETMVSQVKINQLVTEYNNFSKTADLPLYKNRFSVSGYRRVAVK